MQSFRIDIQDIHRLNTEVEAALRRSPEIKEEVLTNLGEKLVSQVRTKIGGHGKVQRWQHTHLGTFKGYVSVHAAERTEDEYGRAVGAVTNAIESGHKIPAIRGKNKRYVPRIKVYRVPGKKMYASTDPERPMADAARQLERLLAENLEE